jgi:hypothetical protein
MFSNGPKREITPLCPVAIKVGQTEVCEPGHDTWRTVTCDKCAQQFSIGPNRTYGSRRSEQDCVQSLEKALAEDYRNDVSHENWYELRD